jgi:hypothetical protein
MTCTREDEVDGRRVKVDVEAIFDTLDDLFFGDLVIARVDNADSFRPAFLSCADRCPQNSFSATSSITMQTEMLACCVKVILLIQ